MIHSFEGLGLESRLVATLTARGYTSPTPIQAALIPTLIEGRDAVGKAPTGTGKTAAFSLPVIHRLKSGQNHIQVLVLAPTRELAVQVADTMFAYGKSEGVSVLPIFGGQAYGRQISRLRKGVDIVVGTPGRLMDLAEKGALDLSKVSTVILDEADEMLSMGFVDDIETILDLTPSDRQTVLMSATMPSRIRKLAKKYLKDAVSCEVEAHEDAKEIRERAYLVNRHEKVAAISRLFETEEVTSALIFAKTQLGTEDWASQLVERSIPAKALHGGMSQDVRTRIINQFRNGAIQVLVGTDVAARGLDIDDISHVFNVDLPLDPEVYVHRIGRTGRAGRSGEAISILAPNEIGKLKRIERHTGKDLERSHLPTEEEIETRRSERVIETVNTWLSRGRCQAERELVQKLVDEGGDAMEIAAAAIRMARKAEYKRPVERISEVERRRPGRSEGGYRGRESSGGGYKGRESSSGGGSGGYKGRESGGGYKGRDGGGYKGRESGGGYKSRESGSGGYKGSESGGGYKKRESGGYKPREGASNSAPASNGDAPTPARKRIARPDRSGPMVTLAIPIGKDSGVRVNNIVSTVARHGGVPAEAIGRVEIGDGRTTIDIRQSEAKRILGKSGELRFGPQRLAVELA
ncbi:MAG: ATP-dependent RNA helicase DeaD [Rhodothermales bacterium]|jgi:ATP-dependent RNA helicase DeaD